MTEVGPPAGGPLLINMPPWARTVALSWTSRIETEDLRLLVLELHGIASIILKHASCTE